MTSKKMLAAFKDALAEALFRVGPIRRKIVKKKLIGGKIGQVELEQFIKLNAPKAYKKYVESIDK